MDESDADANAEVDPDSDGMVTVPWIDEPLELEEAIEAIAGASEDDQEQLERLENRLDRIERRIEALEDGSAVTCPSCGSDEAVYTSGVGAAKLASDGSLSDANADALNGESHVCLDCREAFTPTFE